jgi:hypothetical protein
MDDFLANLFFSLAGFFLAFALVFGRNLFQRLTSRGNLSGVWYQVIPKWEKEAGKLDLIECTHHGDTLSGIIKRLEPQDQRYKSWEFTVKVRKNFIFGAFWSTNVRVNPSYGTLQLSMLDESHLQGFYVKLIATPMLEDDARFTEELNRVPLQWKRRVN